MKVVLYVESERIAVFFELLANGILVKAPMGRSVREFLCSSLHIDTRIEVNGKQCPLNPLPDLKSISKEICLIVETV